MHDEKAIEAAGEAKPDMLGHATRGSGRTMVDSGDSAPEPFSRAASDRLVRLAYRFLWSREDAEDVVQDSLAVAHAQQERLRDPNRWWSWLRRIVIHRCHTAGRRKTRWRMHAGRLAFRADEGAAGTGSGAEEQDFTQLVRRALPGLPDRQKEVIVLRHLEGMSYEQIAQLLEIAPATARVHAKAGLEALREALTGKGIEVSAREHTA